MLSLTDGAIGWADAVVLIPYRFWKIYGDEEILKANYPAMKRYAEFMIRRAEKSRLLSRFKKNPYRRYTYEKGVHFGEWLEPMENLGPGVLFKQKREEATAYYSFTMACLAEIAGRLGDPDAAARYESCAEGAKKAYNYLFVRNNNITADRPAKYVRPLALKLLSETVGRNVAATLLSDTKSRNYCIGTGFLSTPFILPVLSDYGYIDTAYRMLEQEDIPGWLYQVKKGATTIWEKWDAIDKNGKVKASSQNHYSYGAVCSWLFQYVCGIRLDYGRKNSFILSPIPGGSLTKASAFFISTWGEVKSSWEIREDGVHYIVQIPVNTAARLILPNKDIKGIRFLQGCSEFNGECWPLVSGTYELVAPLTLLAQ
jgi:alpha-L-rhamnosidase